MAPCQTALLAHCRARLGMRAMLAGTLANFVSACIAALLL